MEAESSFMTDELTMRVKSSLYNGETILECGNRKWHLRFQNVFDESFFKHDMNQIRQYFVPSCIIEYIPFSMFTFCAFILFIRTNITSVPKFKYSTDGVK